MAEKVKKIFFEPSDGDLNELRSSKWDQKYSSRFTVNGIKNQTWSAADIEAESKEELELSESVMV